jgi:hypothetical protein
MAERLPWRLWYPRYSIVRPNEILLTLASDPNHLGASIGLLAVLHLRRLGGSWFVFL